jgi:oxaloacetate decarboxylase gamma subunit
MELNLVAEGLKFMVLGMVTVFLFLILMVIVLHFQAKLLNKFFPAKALPTRGSANSTQSSPTKDNKALIAAITAAITTFKNTKK